MNEFWIWLARIDSLVGLCAMIATAILALAAWRNTSKVFQDNRLRAERDDRRQKRLAEQIRIVLQNTDDDFVPTGEELLLPYTPRRSQLSRGELLGILGMYYGQPRFPPESLKTILEDGSFSRVLSGEDDKQSWDEVLKIPCSPSVYETFQQNVKPSAS